MSNFKSFEKVDLKDFKKTLEDVAQGRKDFQTKIEEQAEIDSSFQKASARRNQSIVDAIKQAKDDKPGMIVEDKDEIVLSGPVQGIIPHFVTLKPELLSKTAIELDVKSVPFTLIGEPVVISYEPNDTVTLFSPEIEEGLPISKGAFLLLLFPLDVLQKNGILENIPRKSLREYIDVINTFAQGRPIPNERKIKQVQDILTKGVRSLEKIIPSLGSVPQTPIKEQITQQALTGTGRGRRGGQLLTKVDQNGGVFDPSTVVRFGKRGGARPNAGRKTTMIGEKLTKNINNPTPFSAVKPGSKQGVKPNSSYVVKGGKFGDMDVDVPKMYTQLHLTAKKGGNIVLDKKIDKDTVELLTRKANPKKKYSDTSVKTLSKMMKLADHPVKINSKKLEMVQQHLNKKRKSKKSDDNDDADIERLTTLIGSVNAGNYPNKKLQNEISKIAEALLKQGKITKTLYKEILNKYVF